METFDRPVRGFLIDAARTLERPEHYLAAFDFLAARGIDHVIWHFCDDQGCRLAFRSVPGVGSPHALSVGQTRDLVRAARDRGIVLVPEIAALGHCRYITRLPRFAHLEEGGAEYSGMCPVHPQTREVVAALVRETMDVFDAPAIHVGLDEVEIGRHPLTRRALQTRTAAELLADHVGFVRDLVVAEGGRQMWMWGDGLLASPELLERVPRAGVTVCNWQYGPAAGPATTQRLLDAGFDVITASALLSHDQTLFPSTGHALANIRAMHAHAGLRGDRAGTAVRGEIVTTWFPCRSVGGAEWLGWHLAAEIVSGGPAGDAAVRSFGADFHGLADPAAWTDACRTLLALAPRRDEWLAVLNARVGDLSAPVAAALPATAARWQGAARTLRGSAAGVGRHRAEFDALLLLVELLAHAYEVAAAAAGGVPDRAAVRQWVGRRSDLLDRLQAAWVRQRYADDPARTHATVTAFRDDHLLLSVADSIDHFGEPLLAPMAASTFPPRIAVAVNETAR